MAALKNKIDFIALISVDRANPNGDPLNGNRPRTDYNGLGEISDVCIKRKIRNRMQDMGEKIFVQSNDRSDDGCTSALLVKSSVLKKKERASLLACAALSLSIKRSVSLRSRSNRCRLLRASMEPQVKSALQIRWAPSILCALGFTS